MKSIVKFLTICFAAFVMVACSRAPSNVHVISTDDCGAKWEKITTGSAVPKHASNPCGYNIAIPNWPMTGDADFKTQFKGGVLTRGGKYKENGMTFQEDYLKVQLGFLGLTDVKFIFLEGLAMGVSEQELDSSFNAQI